MDAQNVPWLKRFAAIGLCGTTAMLLTQSAKSSIGELDTINQPVLKAEKRPTNIFAMSEGKENDEASDEGMQDGAESSFPILTLPIQAEVIIECARCQEAAMEMLTRSRVTSGGAVLGLDTEWGQTGKVVLLQLSDHTHCMLVRTERFNPTVVPALVELLADAQIRKAGVAVGHDALLLQQQYGLVTRGCVDLRGPAQQHGVHHNNRDGLQALTRAALQRDLSKDPLIRCGAWDREDKLDAVQEEYAALDAHAGREILLAMHRAHSQGMSLAAWSMPYVDIPCKAFTRRAKGGGTSGRATKACSARALTLTLTLTLQGVLCQDPAEEEHALRA